MSALDRRRVLLAMSALLPALASRQAMAQGEGAAPGAHIAPPPRPMVYTRRLERTLVGDARLVVERKFAVRFTRSATGFVVEGEQIAVSVETPEVLAPLARLERERVETGLFPLELDPRGRIRSGVLEEEVPEIDAALEYVSSELAELERGEDERATLQNFVAAIHQAGSNIVSSLPVDLFAPVDVDRIDRRAITLPVGGEGLVSTHFTARRDPATGLMQSARREVVTTFAEDVRRTTETFTLGS